MSEEVQFCLEEAKESMQNALEHLEREMQKVRAGKASPQMVEGIRVDYYGTITPLNQMANVSAPDPKTIFIQPWDKNALQPIEKAIMAANLGFNPMNDGMVIRIPVPPLTEERRKEYVKRAKTEAESARIVIRGLRKDANDTAKKLEKEGTPEDEIKKLETDIQNLTNDYILKIDKIIAAKEKDIMTV
jgi:ribosome recycling factor